MTSPARARTLYEYIESLPEGYAGEIVAGRLYVNPRPSARHVRAGSKLGFTLGNPFDEGVGGPGGWWILDEPEVHFVRDVEVSVPDVAGWRRERMPELPDGHRFEVVPDWVCEILSRRTEATDRGAKQDVYASFGVGRYWIVDPRARTVEALANEGGRWVEAGACEGDEPIRLPPFEAVAIRPPWS